MSRIAASATFAASSPIVSGPHVDLLVFFVVGLLAGAHCLGMCGPLVTVYADRVRSANPTQRSDTLTLFDVRQHVLFNLGRAGSYTLLGGMFVSFGALAFVSIDSITELGDLFRGGVGILIGIAIIVIGAYYLRGQPGISHNLPLVGTLYGHLSPIVRARVDRLAASPKIIVLGGIHGFLPCPIIFPAYLYAFALGDPVRGGISLGILGIGTIPILFAYGTLLGSLGSSTRMRLHRVLGVSFLVLGYVPLQHGLVLYGIHLPHPPVPLYQPL
ncbi:sulfite exporter TauE/SafE family protein (plasmid) [Natrinema zhouii]|uniref:sulfite exporter TauE/SafE family protein n=1 Tax=Natrinema zhouii TaxID=1710539 RepID=UPI001CFF96F9|nr:sulfite exporter TauE/SafE family protein [Natrinema zhouii]UHQ98041.1 sulfite exporter TauE/SafE family protein [Natrinema zhouii]